MDNKEISVQYEVWCSGSGNSRWNCVRDGSRKRVQQAMWFHGILDHLVYMQQPYVAQAMRKKAATIMLQEIWISRGSQFRVQRDFRWRCPDYECYIAAGSDIDLVADIDGDKVPSDGYNDWRVHITVVTFLHKRLFSPKVLVVNWHTPWEKKAL